MSFYHDRNTAQLDRLLAVYVDDTLAAGKKKFKALTQNIENTSNVSQENIFQYFSPV